MKKTNKFSPEVRECAVRMVQEQRGEYPPQMHDESQRRYLFVATQLGGVRECSGTKMHVGFAPGLSFSLESHRATSSTRFRRHSGHTSRG